MIQDIAALKYKSLGTDSKSIISEALYFAIKGQKFNGEDFMEEAVTRGAKGIVLYGPEETMHEKDGVIYYTTPNVRLALSKAASTFYKQQPKTIVAVTGTNGKTSSCYYYKELLRLIGCQSASIGTIGIKCQIPELESKEAMTSPDPLALHKMLSELVAHDITHVALEASSHGLDQHRLDSVHLAAGGFTNITSDHLDYHYSPAAYVEAKMRLFREVLPSGSHVIINADAVHAEDVIAVAKKRKLNVILYGAKENADIRYIKTYGSVLTLQVMGVQYEISNPFLTVDFQIYNAMCALGLAIATTQSISVEDWMKATAQLGNVKGRVELIATHNDAQIYLDYAHTKDGLERVLTNMRRICKSELVVVFGCGGDRDPGKRSEMGKVADLLADKVIITDDNPRNEDAQSIRNAILKHCKKAVEIGDRRVAIIEAIKRLKPGDVLLIAGRGHEEYQIIKEQRLYFSDLSVVSEYLSARQSGF